MPNKHRRTRGRHTARGTLMYLMYQLECGVCCPTTMTFAAVPALAATPSVANHWLPLLTSRRYDGRDVPVEVKGCATVGMSMTEKQGGSDVRANTTTATPVDPSAASEGDEFVLRGHKWFTSAPMSDAFLTLAQTPEGLSCFLVPRWLPDGSRNAGFHVMRLKDKVGDRANASSEVEYDRAWGRMVGAPGRGVRTIVEMVVHTRLDCTIGSAALMRACAQLAAQHTATRSAFGSRLIDAPLMRTLLVDLAVETEAANATWSRLARAFEADGASNDESHRHDTHLRRIATAVSKYWVCKRAVGVAYEAMECFGGNGYVEDGPMARLFRQSPLNAIWEGSGNVICLDVLRAMEREPESMQALMRELRGPRGAEVRLDSLVDDIEGQLRACATEPARMERQARLLVDKMAVALQAATLLQHGHPDVAEAFCASRLPQRGSDSDTCAAGWNYGATRADLGSTRVEAVLIDRLLPSS